MGAAEHTRNINQARTLDYNTALAGRATGSGSGAGTSFRIARAQKSGPTAPKKKRG